MKKKHSKNHDDQANISCKKCTYVKMSKIKILKMDFIEITEHISGYIYRVASLHFLQGTKETAKEIIPKSLKSIGQF